MKTKGRPVTSSVELSLTQNQSRSLPSESRAFPVRVRLVLVSGCLRPLFCCGWQHATGRAKEARRGGSRSGHLLQSTTLASGNREVNIDREGVALCVPLLEVTRAVVKRILNHSWTKIMREMFCTLKLWIVHFKVKEQSNNFYCRSFKSHLELQEKHQQPSLVVHNDLLLHENTMQILLYDIWPVQVFSLIPTQVVTLTLSFA